MKIEAPEENKIVVRLTADDMTKLHITYEEMDYANIETRRVIWTLLDEARRELGRDIDPSGRERILIGNHTWWDFSTFLEFQRSPI